MGKSLVIVESPAKAKTINKYLGNDYIVKSSIGHIRDLPTSGSSKATPVDAKQRAKAAALTRKMSPEEKAIHKKNKAREQLVGRMGVDPDNDWKAHYEILPGKEKVVNELKKLAENADTIYLATDLDREGEAIAWHLRESIGGDDSRYKRVVFNEITKKAIQSAFESPTELDIDRVNAQQARRFLDRIVGYMVSPLLWAKIARGLSAGRVQSVAVRLIVDREKEIRAFIPDEYWQIHTDNTAKSGKLRLELKKQAGVAFRPDNEKDAMAAASALEQGQFKVSAREDKPTKSHPSAPYITSTLQQAASTRLGFGVKKTMMMAQRLYEAGYITYMRTDSTNLSADAVAACRDYISGNFSNKYLPDSPRSYSSKEGAQEAHEAIRPSDVNVEPTQLAGMERDAERLYTLIWRQFVACQMVSADFTSTSITVTSGEFELRTRGRVVRFDGFMKVQPPVAAKKEEDQELPDVKVGEVLALVKVDPTQHFTKPSPRYSEAALVKELEKRGIGRPSTYASIISTIQDRGYVKVENRRFYAEKMGDIVTDRLVESFSNLLDYSFTARMEELLDAVAAGDKNWKLLLNEFYVDFRKTLETAEAADAGMRQNTPTGTDIKCPNCGRDMQIRTASTGVFLGCSGYALPPKERCKKTINLVSGDDFVSIDSDDDEAESKLLRAKKRCQLCNTAMDSYVIDESRKLHICGNNPDCSGHEIEEGSFKVKGYEGPLIECDKCGSDMQLKTGRFGKYFGCTNEECKNTRKLLRSGEAAPPKMDPVPMPELACLKVDDHYILRDGASGLFLAASAFPRNRETRAPLVKEILPHRDEIDEKYAFLFDAPVSDKEGRDTVIRYSRKTKEQYVQTEVDGKPSGWSAFFEGGKWVVREKAAKKAKPKAKASK
ncbi:DNA topoisomerase 1 [Zhongshania aliphaticivorans]|uniref:DNA topoisomerase 1 n=1 Tax=Zhongshania aliphaticivorans TaxID=1470434 RepID=A0A5S9QF68_9GAMM|nr:type I DNA topoisomerase [Zhongshania aliphaticivorans]CAA0088288.1 DNA topoisomerase 1 [Zhongshania aliphaticivorans]CAA0116288.1 DNA topoisomerase 1 [Zhongshania aliphaticivorans]CAA0120408.1 DNA topoisomerase 1 [Zhongshania aliphaticivorans]